MLGDMHQYKSGETWKIVSHTAPFYADTKLFSPLRERMKETNYYNKVEFPAI